MGYLNKEQYNYRREAAARRSQENELIAISNGMTESQAELITELCSLRHEFHSNMDAITRADESRVLRRLVALNSRIRESDLTPMDFMPSYEDDYILIDTIAERMEFARIDGENIEDWDAWYAENYEEIYHELSELHEQIEKYLSKIDKKYRTKFAPTGALRIL